MRPEDDFTAYVAARWPQLVRLLAVLGCPDELLEDVAVDGLVRCRRSWAATVRSGDADREVPDAVLAAWTERRRTDWWVGVPPPSYSAERAAAAAILDRLPEAERTAVALGEPSVLDAQQQAVVDRAVEAVPVLAPPLDAVLRRPVRRRPGRARRVALVAAAAVVVGAGAFAVVRPDAADPPAAAALDPARASAEDNPVDVLWYADGQVHLRDVAVRTGEVLDLVEVVDGAAYVDPDGRVVRVDEQGARTLLGRTDPAEPVAASADGIQVVWRDAAGGDLVVRDLRRDREVRRVPGTALSPVAIDDGELFYNAPDGSYAARLPDGAPRRVRALPLLDVRSGSQLFRRGDGFVLLHSARLRTEITDDGAGGSLSDDGRFALVGGRSGVAALDLLGGRQAAGAVPGDTVLAARPVGGSTVVLVVEPGGRPEPADPAFGRLSEVGSWDMRVCVIGTGACRRAARISAAGSVPLFAH